VNRGVYDNNEGAAMAHPRETESQKRTGDKLEDLIDRTASSGSRKPGSSEAEDDDEALDLENSQELESDDEDEE
jgi:hypothetical protein